MKRFIERHSHLFHKLGLSLSFLCAIHCLAMPFVLVLLPFLGANFFSDEAEFLMIGVSLLIGFFVLLKDYRHHDNILPLVLLGASFCLVLLHVFVHNHVIVSLSSISMAVAYFYNWRLHKNVCSHS
ncbi:MerC domain-containing protein [Arcticibacterium luteifluviistationis]|uniref:MerC domain-containing protein n=1 Tax=Arcticibacterium luteifluviistationis TaxID=1784714 RepID=A0A2Z4GFB8_9BACT|nr:MerC domain-containing protein [Arcticibacterium luteifluviistationis]AWV99483.1 hypothetical protein DJ013_15460 [Arcticibacterium luteifluviistationis]